jgi:hypothetical protein
MRRYRRQSGALILAVLAAISWAALPAAASVAVLVEEPYGGMSGMDPSGHSAVYLDHVCAASPIKLRTCREGELGVVVSRYDGIGHYDWLAMPLLAYLYAVDSAADVPTSVDKATEDRLRDAYRREHLMSIVPDREDGSAPGGNWYELVGSAFDRTLYGFQVKTTAEQDAALIAIFNDRKNVERYNAFFTNCADFSRVTVNRFYPHAVRRNFLADLGMTSPKQVAHALTKYGDKHPQVGLTVFRVPQVPGSLPRSHAVKGFMETMLTSKRYVVPITALEPVATAAVFVAYVGGGRFPMPKDAPLLLVRTVPGVEGIGSLATDEALPTPPSVVKTSFSASGAALLVPNP